MNNSNQIERVIFKAPTELKKQLQELANQRNITLSSLLRLISTEYVKRNKQT